MKTTARRTIPVIFMILLSLTMAHGQLTRPGKEVITRKTADDYLLDYRAAVTSEEKLDVYRAIPALFTGKVVAKMTGLEQSDLVPRLTAEETSVALAAMSAEQKTAMFASLTLEQRLALMNKASSADQSLMMNSLSDADMAAMIDASRKTKAVLWAAVASKRQASVFSAMSAASRSTISKSLSAADRASLIMKLDSALRSEMMMSMTDLERASVMRALSIVEQSALFASLNAEARTSTYKAMSTVAKSSLVKQLKADGLDAALEGVADLRTLSGTVTTPAKEGLIGVTLQIKVGEELVETVVTGEGGAYSVSLEKGDYTVNQIVPEGYTTVENPRSVSFPEDGDLVVDFVNTPDAPPCIEGTVDANNGDTSGACVSAVEVSLYNEAGEKIATTMTDDKGAYSFCEGIKEGSVYSVGATKGLHAEVKSAAFTAVKSKSGKILAPKVTVKAATRIAVRVANKAATKSRTLETSKTIETPRETTPAKPTLAARVGVKLALRVASTRELAATAVTMENGYAIFDATPGVEYALNVCGQDPDTDIPVTAEECKDTIVPEMEFAEEAVLNLGSVRGKITSKASEAGLAGIPVRIYKEGALVKQTVSLEAGAYSLTDLEAGDYVVAVCNERPEEGTPVTVDPCSEAETNLTATPTSEITGTIRVGTGERAIAKAGIRVAIYNAEGVKVATAITTEGGRYSVKGLAAGSYSVKACEEEDDPSLPGTPVTTEECGTTEAPEKTVAGTSEITGTVKVGTGERAIAKAGIRVAIYNAEGVKVATAITTEGGRYSVKGLAAGAYTVKSCEEEDDPSVPGTPVTTEECGTTEAPEKTVAGTSEITGTIRVGTGEKAVAKAGIRVVIFNAEGVKVATAITTEGGRYSVKGLAAGSCSVKACEEEDDPSVPGTPVTTEECGTTEAPEKTVAGTSEITGTIRVGTGEKAIAKAGIRVAIYNAEGVKVATAITTEGGRYSVKGLAAGAYTVKSCEEEDDPSVPGTPVTTEECGTTEAPEKTVAGTSEITGTVKVGTGEKAIAKAGIRVAIYNAEGVKVATAITTEGGRYSVKGLAAGAYSVKACEEEDDPSVPGTPVTTEECGTTEAPEKEVAGTSEITGTVKVGTGEKAIAKAGIRVAIYNAEGVKVATAITTEGGRYSVKGLAAGSYSVKACEEEDDPSVPGTPVTTEECGTTEAPEKTVAGTSEITGTVNVGTGERAIAKAGIRVAIYNAEGVKVATAITTEGGRYSVKGLVAGSYSVKACEEEDDPSVPGTPVTTEECGTTEAPEKTVAGTSEITGTVNVGTGEKAIAKAGIRVAIYNAEGVKVASAITAEGGRYSVKGLAAGTYSVKACEEEGDPSVPGTPVTTEECGTTEAPEKTVAGTSEITGTVNVGTGERAIAKAGIRVAVYNAEGVKVATAITTEGGRYSVKGLAAGAYSVKACEEEDDPSAPGTPVTTEECGTTEAPEKTVFGTSEITGTVNVGTGERAIAKAGIRVAVYNAEGVKVATAITTEGGRYSVKGLAAGAYSVKACEEEDDPSVPGTPVTTEECGTTEAPEKEVAGTSSLSGLIKSGTGEAAIAKAGIRVAVYNAEGVKVASLMTDDSGRYSVKSLPAGVYTVKTCHEIDDPEVPGTPVTTEECGHTEAPVKEASDESSVIGLLTDAKGFARDAAVIRIRTKGATAELQSVTSDAFGAYTFSGLKAGTYEMLIDTCGEDAVVEVEVDECGHTVAPTLVAQPTFTLSGKVVYDIDRSKTDDEEPRLSGVQIRLMNGIHEIDSTNTADDGTYSFCVVNGDYTVVETDPETFISSEDKDGGNDNEISVTVDGDDAPGNDFLDTKLCLHGTVFFDSDKDGSTGEAFLGNVKVRVTNSENELVAELTTDENGDYHVCDLSPGTYTITEIDPDGFVSTGDTDEDNDNEIVVVLTDTDSVDNDFFDTEKTHCLHGSVVKDDDRSVTKGESESTLSGVKIRVFQGDKMVAEAVTGEDGSYHVCDLVDGTYTVTEEDPEGYESTGDKDGEEPNTITTIIDGEDSEGNDFFDAEIPEATHCLHGSVVKDDDRSVTKGESESTLSGVKIRVFQGDKMVAEAVTGEDGSYHVCDLDDGTYTVTEEDPEGYESTGDKDGEEPNTITTVIDGEDSEGNDFFDAEIPEATHCLHGSVVNDEDRSATKGEREANLSGVKIRVFQGDNLVAEAITGEDGSYHVCDLVDGEYVVTEEDPFGYESTGDKDGEDPNHITTEISGDDVDGLDFFDAEIPEEKRCLHGSVVNDADRSATKGAGEAGLAGIKVRVSQGENLIAEVVTSDDGSYHVCDLVDGIYTVTAEDPDGYESTGDKDGDEPNSIKVVITGEDSEENDFFDAEIPEEKFCVHGSVLNDENGSESIDSTDVNMSDVVVRIFKGDSLVAEVQTVDGTFHVCDLSADTYTVMHDVPEGFDVVTDSDGGEPNLVTVVVSDEDVVGVDFLDAKIVPALYNLDGYVIFDRDEDAEWDAGETVIAGVDVKLLSESGDVLKTTVTDDSGYYRFTNLEEGTYSVVESNPANHISTGDIDGANDDMISAVISGGDSLSNNFFDVMKLSISGSVIYDQNADGSEGAEEPGIEDVVITLEIDGDVIATVNTDSEGDYVFEGLLPGDYLVRENDPSGFFSTSDVDGGNDNSIAVSLVDTDSVGNDFLDAKQSSITGTVVDDKDNDGTPDADEPGKPGVIVQLVNPETDEVISEVITDENGVFEFETVPAGDWVVVQLDPDTGDRTETLVTVTTGSDSEPLELVDNNPVSITGSVTQDDNGNGVVDANEPGLPGVTVTLSTIGGDVLAVVQTDDNGTYAFPPVGPGTYVITETDPNETYSTGDSDGINDNMVVVNFTGSNELTPVNFSDAPGRTISGSVRNDMNGNGTPDSDENGIEGSMVQLLDAAGDVIAEVKSDENGDFAFTAVLPGDYVIREVNPEGMISNFDTDGGEDLDLVAITVASGIDPEAVVFLNYMPVTLTGAVWNDVNFNGSAADENLVTLGLNGIKIVLMKVEGDSTVVVDEVLASQVDGMNGQFSFSGLIPGEYIVAVDPETIPEELTLNSTPLSAPLSIGSGDLLVAPLAFGLATTPTAIELLSFDVAKAESGVALTWTTASETDVLGYNVYRAASPEAAREKVNAEIILAANSLSGSSYTLSDTVGGAVYFLEEITTSLAAESHGPFAGATADEGILAQAAGIYMLNADNAAQADVTVNGNVVPSLVIDDALVFYLAEAGASIAVADSATPTRMLVADAAPEAGETATVKQDDGKVSVSTVADYANYLMIDWASEPIVLDVTNPSAPVALVGSVIRSDDGMGVYFSSEAGRQLHAAEVK